MSIKVYSGRMGSGKTYEVTSVVIYNALAKGRRVVSNIVGLNFDVYQDLLEKDNVPVDAIGEIVQVAHEDILKHDFWLTDSPDCVSFLRAGDLLVLDEIWRFWDGFSSKNMPMQVMNFIRMQRHFVNSESGFTCDVILITQDVMDISRRVRAVVEETYRMEKLTSLGLTKRYRVDIFTGYNLRKKPLRQLQRKYDAKYFPLYTSHSQKKDDVSAVEDNVDDRGNVLKGKLFVLVLPLFSVVFCFAFYFLWGFFNPKDKGEKPVKVDASADVKPSVLPVAARVPQAASPDVSSRWRMVGSMVDAFGYDTWIITDGQKTRVLYNPPRAKTKGWNLSIETPEGDIVTLWSGASDSRKEERFRP
jgi:zona occludens toxin